MSVIITRNIPKVRTNFQRGQSVTTGWLIQERLHRARLLRPAGFLVSSNTQEYRSMSPLDREESHCKLGPLLLKMACVILYKAAVWIRVWDNTVLWLCLTSRTSSVSPAPAGKTGVANTGCMPGSRSADTCHSLRQCRTLHTIQGRCGSCTTLSG